LVLLKQILLKHRFMKTFWLCFFILAVTASAQQSASAPGAKSFETRCTVCHGGDGNGSERAPSILNFVASNPDSQIALLIRNGIKAMPPHEIADPEMKDLITFVRTLRPVRGPSARPVRRATAKLQDGKTLEGDVLNQTNFDLQLATADGKVHILTLDARGMYRENPVSPKMDWPRYDGSYTGNRNSPLDQINSTNVQRLTMKWMFPIPDAPRLESTPVVVDGVMYVTAVNAVYALDATSGRQLWAYRRPVTPGLLGEAAGGANRGVVVEGDRVFMLTDNAHLLALNKNTGALLWDRAMTDWPKSQYSATGVPLVVGEMVIAGVAGGEEGARGFVAAYQASTGEEAWRFWTIPKPGEKLSETWVGNALEHGCGATWLSGSYDPELDLLYWAVGNPCPDFNGDERKGDNLYSDSVLALKPKTGELKWFYQFTPHDTHDWDATEPLLLVDETFAGRPRKLLVQANRNGFFFVLDRTNGEFLLGKPYTKSTWASGYTKDGKPILLPNSDPTPQGVLECPDSGTNWMSASYNPLMKLYFFSASDTCGITRQIPAPFEMGSRFFNGTRSAVPGGKRSIRAIDIQTGNIVWDYAQTPGGRSASGTLSTNSGLVFAGEDSGVFTALDGKTGKPLWHFPVNQSFRASPMTYMVGGRQYVSIATQAGFLTFSLPDR
jgi:alcohol dehydrogenase (cytochrome c)